MEFGKEGRDLPKTINSWSERGLLPQNEERSLINVRRREEIAPLTENI